MANMARWCCCGGECPSSVELTFTGVDAGLCPDCYPKLGNSFDYQNLSLDGAWLISKVNENDFICLYQASRTGGTGIGSVDIVDYAGVACAGAPTATNTYTLSAEVIYTKASAKITSVSVLPGIFPGGTAFDSGAITAEFGDSINNALACGGNNISNAGSVVVAIP